MHSLGKRISPVQFRVRAPLLAMRQGGRPQGPQSSQRSSGFHKPAVSGAAPETATILASTQQPADFFCKEFLPERHRLEAPCYGPAPAARVAQAFAGGHQEARRRECRPCMARLHDIPPLGIKVSNLLFKHGLHSYDVTESVHCAMSIPLILSVRFAQKGQDSHRLAVKTGVRKSSDLNL